MRRGRQQQVRQWRRQTARSWKETSRPRCCWGSSSGDRPGWCREPRGRGAGAWRRRRHCGSRPVPAAPCSAPSWCRPASRRPAAARQSSAAWTTRCTGRRRPAAATDGIATEHHAYYKHTCIYTHIHRHTHTHISFMLICGSFTKRGTMSKKDQTARDMSTRTKRQHNL